MAGKLVTIRGTVVRISPIKPLVQSASFACGKCGSEQHVVFKEGIFTLPMKCGVDGCRSKNFNLLKRTAQSIDWQKIRVQVQPHALPVQRSKHLLHRLHVLPNLPVYNATLLYCHFMYHSGVGNNEPNSQLQSTSVVQLLH